jgi:hypothetical protein
MASSFLTNLETFLGTQGVTTTTGNFLAGILHRNTASTGLDLDKKTMTTTWEEANSANAAVLLSEPPSGTPPTSWRIVPD